MNFQQKMFAGYSELKSALLSHEQWLFMAIQDTKMRYRRSILGPWWVTLSTGIMVLMLGFLWSFIFNQAISDYLPFFSVSFIVWNWISAQINESTSGFIQFQGVIKQIKLPLPIFILRVNFRQFMILMHNSVVIFLVFLFLQKGFSWVNLIAVPNLFLVQANITLLSILVAIICSRYQDMIQIVSVVTQITFFFTPILWQVDLIKNRLYLAEWNPIYHWIEMIRAPLLGQMPCLNDYVWTCASLVFIFFISTFSLGTYRSRIPLWL